jgi:threonine/homoserine/homoserine lactone efflux protein
MDFALLISAAIAGAIVVLTPGPAVIAFIGIGAARGRWAGAQFLFGHLLGDTLWCSLALVALVGANLVSPWLFHGLALACGLYLLWLGTRAVLVRKRPDGGTSADVSRPYVRGVLFGVSNPKSYPVTLAVFTAILAGQLGGFGWNEAPIFLAACLAGFVAADFILIWIVGTGPLRRFYATHEIWIIRGTGVMFIGFALNTLWHLARELTLLG